MKIMTLVKALKDIPELKNIFEHMRVGLSKRAGGYNEMPHANLALVKYFFRLPLVPKASGHSQGADEEFRANARTQEGRKHQL